MMHLSKRQRIILQHVADGLTYPEIALKEYVTINTVKTHIRMIFFELDVHSRAHAVTVAREYGLIS